MTDRKGFTLIEILLVVVIIGILAAVIVPKFAGRGKEARIVAARAAIENIGTSLDMFELDNGRYPKTDEGLDALWEEPDITPALPDWKGPYVKKPNFVDPWGNPFVYKSPGDHNTEGYDLFSTGPNSEEGGGDDITNWEVE